MLVRYIVAATLARSADGGAGLGLILLVLTPAAHLTNPGLTGGLLVAGLGAPHVLGPVVARRLDATADGRRFLAVAFAGYGVALGAGAVLLGHVPTGIVGACIAIAGACGPLLTGGLSSRLHVIVAPDAISQRRAEGWDSLTYGVGGTAGPALVAGLAALTSPLTALLVLAVAALAASGLTLNLPPDAATSDGSPPALTVTAALALIVRLGPLRRVVYATLMTAIAMGGLSIVAVHLGAALSDWPSAGAVLAAMFGVGNLLGSVVVTARPVRGEPERSTLRFAVVMAGAYVLCALAPTYPLAIAAFTLAGIANAPFFTATLAARSQYAPATARAQVFVSIAGLKVAASASGAALAGAFLGMGSRILLAVAAALTVAAAVAMAADLKVSRAVQTAGQRSRK